MRTNFDATKQLPVDGTIVFAFDRLLEPSTVTRQSIALRDAFGQATASPVIVYDPVARTVTLSDPGVGTPWLLENQPYKVILGVPKNAADLGGVRAIDGATLATPLVLGFITSGPAGIVGMPTISFCDDVLPIFQANCAECHGSPSSNTNPPSMGLSWISAAAIVNTAIGRASEEMNTGPTSGPGVPNGGRFGIDMPIVDPSNPGNSYLMYKLLAWGEPPPPASNTSIHEPLTDAERMRLRDRIEGQPMPIATPLSFDEVEVIRSWIAQGAATTGCP